MRGNTIAPVALQLGLFFPVVFSIVGCADSDKEQSSGAVEVADLAEIKRAFDGKDFERTIDLALSVSKSIEGYHQAMLIAGEASFRLDRHQQALEFLSKIPENQTKESVNAQFFEGEIRRELGQLQQAAKRYQKVLANRPNNLAIHERLAFIYSVTGQSWKSLPHFQTLCRSGDATISNLALYADLSRPVADEGFLKKCQKSSPNDPFVRLAFCRDLIHDAKSDAAIKELEKILEANPELSAGQAAIGKLLLQNDEPRFLEWLVNLPKSVFEDPEVWVVAGTWARERKDISAAMYCFWNAIRRSPTHRDALSQFGQMLAASNDPQAERVNKLVEIYSEISQFTDYALQKKGEQSLILQRIVTLCLQSGRVWEACAWAIIAKDVIPNAQWVDDVFAKYTVLLNEKLPTVVDERNVAKWFDLSNDKSFQKFVSREKKRIASTIASGADRSNTRVARESYHFELEDAGIGFTYFNGQDDRSPAARMFETTGGGIAVLDFDLNGTPDLFFTQGGTWPWGSRKPQIAPGERDVLYSQIDDVGYREITREALPSDFGYGQGVAVGDFNSDGFPDLYIANSRRNQLLQNMGDGTFLDVSEESGVTEELWTSSVLMIDLNADGHPDLFDANYLEGPGVFTKVCKDKSCSPLNFLGAPNQIWINNGRGRFEEGKVDEPRGNSKSLGIAVLFDEGSNIPSLFIANDQVQNFFLRPAAKKNSNLVEFRDQALASGLAFNDEGLAMACMGIATADLNQDGLADLFVTNFKNESNTVYLQDIPGLFIDITKRTGLNKPGFKYVGWGTQFLDANLNGRVDLIVTNGHVDDLPEEESYFQMPLQFFANMGDIRFEELPQAGEVFQRDYAGRALAKLDWNRDGKMDFVVSTLNSTAFLVSNRSKPENGFINVKLHASSSSRDAVGSRITFSSSQGTQSEVLSASDGYHVSNQRLIQFVSKESDQSTFLQVDWPSGAKTLVKAPERNSTLELFEGFDVGTQWKGGEPRSISCKFVAQP